MIKNQFKDQTEFNTYIAEQKIAMEKGWLTRSEREQIKNMLDKNYKPHIVKETPKKTAKPLVTNYKQLRRPCESVTKEDDINSIVKDLKDALNAYGGIGISANQIGIQKRISYLRIPKVVNKKIDFAEIILINPKILERDTPIKVRNEACLSFPGVYVDTQRFVYITVENYNEKLEPMTFVSQDLEAITIQHEYSHLLGRTIFEDKWRAK